MASSKPGVLRRGSGAAGFPDGGSLLRSNSASQASPDARHVDSMAGGTRSRSSSRRSRERRAGRPPLSYFARSTPRDSRSGGARKGAGPRSRVAALSKTSDDDEKRHALHAMPDAWAGPSLRPGAVRDRDRIAPAGRVRAVPPGKRAGRRFP
jgi:hypothetical protein